jgi:hypothetical protein
MLKKFLRNLSIFLSIFFFNQKKIDKNKHTKIEEYIKKKVIIKFKKNPRLSTHQKFSKEIVDLINLGKLKNFLRNSLLQNIMFIHNRLFIFFELKELKRDKNWETWKQLIIENDIGNPVRYFLYSVSSGNRIRQVYIIKKFCDSLNTNIKISKIKNIIEIGGGYGCMADIYKKINKKVSYTIYDMFETNLLQYYYLKMNNFNPVIDKISTNLCLTSNLSLLYKISKEYKNYMVIANWSLSEFPIKLRKKFFKLIEKSEITVISFQENFEDINNFNFFMKFLKKLRKKFNFKIQKYDHYNKSYFNNNKHFMLTLVKNEKNR